MKVDLSRAWRLCFVAGGILYIVGGYQHPRGVMVDMLADPSWVPGHATIFVGLLVLTTGLALFRRTGSTSRTTDRWLLFTIVATALEAVEMGVHTIAYVDAEALALGGSTPVLTTHLWLAALIYPVFGVALFGLIWHTQRERSLGSPWIGWIGMLGAAAHGVVMTLVWTLEIGWGAVLFPVAAFALSLWFILAGLWPAARSAPTPTAPRAVAGAG